MEGDIRHFAHYCICHCISFFLTLPIHFPCCFFSSALSIFVCKLRYFNYNTTFNIVTIRNLYDFFIYNFVIIIHMQICL
jgi:hypothetical protein